MRFSPQPIHVNVNIPSDVIAWCRSNSDAIACSPLNKDFQYRCILELQQKLLDNAPSSPAPEDGSEADEEAKRASEDLPSPEEEISQEVLMARKVELEEIVRKARAELNKLELQMD